MEANGSGMRPTSSSAAEGDKLQLLQLQCIIDSKDREIHLLRKRLSGQEDAEVVIGLQDDIARLRVEVQRLSQENAALRAQCIAAAVHNRGASMAGAEPQQRQPLGTAVTGSNATSFPHPGVLRGSEALAAADAKAPPPSPPTGPIDAGALVEKLRSLVTGLVAEALAAQQEQQGLSRQGNPMHANKDPREPLQHQHQDRHQYQHQQPLRHTAAGAQVPECPAYYAPRQQQDQQQQVAAAPANMLPASSAAAYGASGAAFPGVHVIVHQHLPQHLPGGWPPHTSHGTATTAPSTMATPTAVIPGAAATPGLSPPPWLGYGVGSGTGQSGASGANIKGSSSTAAVPAVLELNVDGTVVYVDRAVLETQAHGSRLFDAVVRHYHDLPLDSQGRPYLSYDPLVFQVLLSFLKERWLFGGSAAAACDWARVVHSLGVSVPYFAQVASHFGLPDLVASLSPPDHPMSTAAGANGLVPGQPPLGHPSPAATQHQQQHLEQHQQHQQHWEQLAHLVAGSRGSPGAVVAGSSPGGLRRGAYAEALGMRRWSQPPGQQAPVRETTGASPPEPTATAPWMLVNAITTATASTSAMVTAAGSSSGGGGGLPLEPSLAAVLFPSLQQQQQSVWPEASCCTAGRQQPPRTSSYSLPGSPPAPLHRLTAEAKLAPTAAAGGGEGREVAGGGGAAAPTPDAPTPASTHPAATPAVSASSGPCNDLVAAGPAVEPVVAAAVAQAEPAAAAAAPAPSARDLPTGERPDSPEAAAELLQPQAMDTDARGESLQPQGVSSGPRAAVQMESQQPQQQVSGNGAAAAAAAADAGAAGAATPYQMPNLYMLLAQKQRQELGGGLPST